MTEPGVRRWTLADLDTLPDQDSWIRYEIIDGELFESEVAGNQHQETCALTGAELVLWNRQAGLGSVLVGPGLIFSDDNNTIPDLVWVSHARRAALEQALASDDLSRAYDDAQLVEAAGGDVRIVEAPRQNLKITTSHDLRVAAWLLEERAP